MKYRKKPVVIDAFLMNPGNISDLKKFVTSFGDDFENLFQFIDEGPDGGALKVHTLEGTSYSVQPGEWIIRGVNGEYYPCKPDIFKKTYQPANETTDPSGWISCEDRLPENDDGIMLFTEEEGVFQGWAEEDEHTGRRNNFYFGGNQRAYGVTHWQPLPAAPLVNNLNK